MLPACDIYEFIHLYPYTHGEIRHPYPYFMCESDRIIEATECDKPRYRINIQVLIFFLFSFVNIQVLIL